jgi:tetratricopeptide (TPR) repeat protein
LNDLGAVLAAEAAGQPDSRFASEALRDFDLALRVRPDFAPALYNRALLLNVLGHREEACRTLSRFTGIETDPGWRSEASSRISCPAGK